MSHNWQRVVGKMRRAGFCCGLLALAGLAGCSNGGDDPFSGKYVKINGSVHYADGSLITVPPDGRISVIFTEVNPQAVNGNQFARPGSAEVNVADGTFDQVTSYKFGEGVVAGKYKVTIKATDRQQKPLLDVIGANYGDAKTTPIKDVDTATMTLPLDLTVEKPVAGKKKAERPGR